MGTDLSAFRAAYDAFDRAAQARGPERRALLEEALRLHPLAGPDEPASANLGAEIFRSVFDRLPRASLIMAADPPRFTMLAANPAHARTFSTTREALEGKGVFEVFPPDPTPLMARFMGVIRASLEKVMSTGEPDEAPAARLVVADASGKTVERYWAATITPIIDDSGAITHLVSSTQDITGEVHERRSERARDLLIREVDHRARNALAVVQSLIRLSTASSLEEFRANLEGRIESMARAQTSLAARKWEGAFLDDIVRHTLSAMSASGQVTVDGPRVVLPPADVQALSMIVHELTTNAVKYGSLAQPGGALAVTWRRGNNRSVRLVWREEGSVMSGAPTSGGFGSRLVAQLVSQLHGTASFDWRPSGLIARLSFRLSARETERATED